MAKINLNDKIKVELTDHGKEIYRKYLLTIYYSNRANILDDLVNKEIHEFQLWEFINIFSSRIFMGMEQVIKNNDIILGD